MQTTAKMHLVPWNLEIKWRDSWPINTPSSLKTLRPLYTWPWEMNKDLCHKDTNTVSKAWKIVGVSKWIKIGSNHRAKVMLFLKTRRIKTHN
jgi:hypothetical protein